MSAFPLSLQDFHVSENYGFILEDPLEVLPEYFSAWNYLAKKITELVEQKQMRTAVEKLEVLDHTRLCGYREHRLAHVQLCMITAGYVWQDGDAHAAKVLPRCLAVPLCGVSEKLGMKPVMCHASIALANMKLDPKTGDIWSLYLLPGREDTDAFISVTLETEMAFNSGLKNMMSALHHAQEENIKELITCLNGVAVTMGAMITAMGQMHKRLNAEVFYDVLRPFLSGDRGKGITCSIVILDTWGGSGSALPDGLIYEGISDEPRKVMGGSAAQSSTIQCIDALLGITHAKGQSEFLTSMRTYMPPAHRGFIEYIEKHSQIKPLVKKMNNEKLTSAYNKCVKSVADFRTFHLQIVSKYIIVMRNRDHRNKDIESLATRGTGGSDLIPFLKSIRSTTAETQIKDKLHEG